jgi:hypothetical protein
MYLRRMKNSFPLNKEGLLDQAGRQHTVSDPSNFGNLNLQSPSCKGNSAIGLPATA